MSNWRRSLTEPPRLQTGISQLDRLLPGLLSPGRVTILGARPGVGKTLLAMQIADYVIESNPDKPVLITSLEMTDQDLGRRHVIKHAIKAGTPLRDPYLWGEQKDEEAICSGILDLARKNYRFWSGGRGLGDVLRGVNEAIKLIGTPSLLVVDYVQLLRSGAATREREIGQASTALTELVKQIGVPLLLLAQLNRGPTSNGQTRPPVLSDLRDSGQIEQDADAVLLLHKPLPDRNSIRAGTGAQGAQAEIIIAKARHWPMPQCPVITMSEIGLEWVPSVNKVDDSSEKAVLLAHADAYAQASQSGYSAQGKQDGGWEHGKTI